MDLSLRPEQELIRNTVRDFVREHVTPHARAWDKEHRFPRETFDRLGPLGLLGALIPAQYGGAGLDKTSYLLALEELAYGDAGFSVSVAVHTSVAATPIVVLGTEEQKARMLPALASGKTIGAFAVTEPQTGSDLASLRTTAERRGDAYVLNGSKVFITNGSMAGRVIVAARTPGSQGNQGITLFAVDASTPGFQRGGVEEKMGLRSSDTARLSFQDMEVPAADRLGAEGEGFHALMSILNSSRLAIAAQAVGMARRAHDESIAYAKQRTAFGQTISKHQAVQFLIADMATRIEAARLLTYKAGADEDRGELRREASSMAKLLASETLVWVAEAAVQVHGGNGYIKDYAVERIMRDAPVTRIYEGTSEVQKLVIGRAIAAR